MTTKISHACYDNVIEYNDHLVHYQNGDNDHLFYNNTEQRGLSQPIIDESREVPENLSFALPPIHISALLDWLPLDHGRSLVQGKG